MTIDNLEINIKSSSQQASNGIDALASSLAKLKSITKGGAGLNTIANQLNKLNSALSNLPAGTANANIKILSIVNALNQLSGVGKSAGFTSTINSLKKLPEVMDGLEKVDMNKFATSIKRVADAMKPLADEMDKVSRGFSALPAKMQKIIQSNNTATKSFNRLGLAAKVATAVVIGRTIGDWVRKSNEYVENLNLFTVSMGKYAKEAREYAEEVANVMGIDPSDWMRNQGIFNTLATGFGLAGDKAAIMSKNLTQLSYDLSSFYNISVEDATQKLQSAFAGELEPVRRLGYDLSQTRLQSIAYEKGIRKQVSAMNQAEKSQLRYIALMEQVQVVQGDMARTINTPANQLRIFRAQLEQTKRALGNIFIPALNAVLPYLIAFLKLIRAIATELANLFGFELPEIDYSGLDGLGSGAAENLDDATAAAKKLKSATMGFDELNILSQDDGNGANGGVGGGSGFDLDPSQYDFLAGLKESEAAQIFKEKFEPVLNWIKENFDKILAVVTMIGIVLLSWKLAEGLTTGLPLLAAHWKDILSIVGLIAGGSLILWGVWDSLENGINWDNLTAILAGIGIIAGLLGLRFGNLAMGVFLVVSGIGMVALGIKDIMENGFNEQNVAAVLTGLALITLGLFAIAGVNGLIAGAIISLVVLFVLFADRVAGSTNFILAVLGNLVKFLGNVGMVIIDLAGNVIKFVGNIISAAIAAVGNFVKAIGNVISGAANVIKAVCSNIKNIFSMAWNHVQAKFYTMADNILSGIKSIAEKANNLLGIFGVNIDLTGWDNILNEIKNKKQAAETAEADAANAVSTAISDAWQEGMDTFKYTDIEEAFNKFKYADLGESFKTFEYTDVVQAYDEGAEAGANFRDGLFDAISGAGGNLFEQLGLNSDGSGNVDLKVGGTLPEIDASSLAKGLSDSGLNASLDNLKLGTDDITKLVGEDILNNDKMQIDELGKIDETMLNADQNITTQLNNDTTYLGEKLDEVRRACEDIEINVYNSYGSDEYATGGFPTKGNLFIANEAGPEMVGNIGGRAAVANNDQITQAIAQAVYGAIVNANQQRSDNNFNVYIDGRQVNAAVEKVRKEKGTSIMTGGLIYG